MGSLAAPNARPFFSSDGRWIATASGEGFVFWDRTTWARVHSIAADKGSARLDFSPDGRLFALSVGRGQVELFDATTFGSLAKFETPEMNDVSGIAFSPDSAQMAVCSAGPDIQLWNLRSIRHQLAAMKLDFDAPPIGPATNSSKATKITVATLPTPVQ
jgi:WD40 repeat protein